MDEFFLVLDVEAGGLSGEPSEIGWARRPRRFVTAAIPHRAGRTRSALRWSSPRRGRRTAGTRELQASASAGAATGVMAW